MEIVEVIGYSTINPLIGFIAFPRSFLTPALQYSSSSSEVGFRKPLDW